MIFFSLAILFAIIHTIIKCTAHNNCSQYPQHKVNRLINTNIRLNICNESIIRLITCAQPLQCRFHGQLCGFNKVNIFFTHIIRYIWGELICSMESGTKLATFLFCVLRCFRIQIVSNQHQRYFADCLHIEFLELILK